MKIKATDYDYQRWRRAFALFPVRIHNQWVWLEWYWVRGMTGLSWQRARTEDEQSRPYSLVSY